MNTAPGWRRKEYGYVVVFHRRCCIELRREEDGWIPAVINEPVVYPLDLALPFKDALTYALEVVRRFGVDEENIQYVRQSAPIEV